MCVRLKLGQSRGPVGKGTLLNLKHLQPSLFEQSHSYNNRAGCDGNPFARKVAPKYKDPQWHRVA